MREKADYPSYSTDHRFRKSKSSEGHELDSLCGKCTSADVISSLDSLFPGKRVSYFYFFLENSTKKEQGHLSFFLSLPLTLRLLSSLLLYSFPPFSSLLPLFLFSFLLFFSFLFSSILFYTLLCYHGQTSWIFDQIRHR